MLEHRRDLARPISNVYHPDIQTFSQLVMTESKAVKPTLVRIPDELKTWLKREAEKNDRSLNGEIIARLQESREKQKKDRS